MWKNSRNHMSSSISLKILKPFLDICGITLKIPRISLEASRIAQETLGVLLEILRILLEILWESRKFQENLKNNKVQEFHKILLSIKRFSLDICKMSFNNFTICPQMS